MLGAIALEDRRLDGPARGAVAAAFLEGVRDLGIEALPWTPAAERFAARVAWLRRQRGGDLPDLSRGGLLAGARRLAWPVGGGHDPRR